MNRPTSALKIILIVLLVLVVAAAIALPYILNESETPIGTPNELSKKVILDETDLSEAYEDAFDADNYSSYSERSKNMASLVNVTDLNLPTTLTDQTNKQKFGLYVFNGNSYVLYNEASENTISPEKKTIFYAHGMGGNSTIHNARGLYENGYNVLCLQWGAFANEEGMSFNTICEKVWMYDSPKRYRSKDGKGWVDDSGMYYSVAEIYAAYYLDFLKKNPACLENEITITGHSYGGMLTSALLSYLTTAYRCGLLEIQYLPDRADLFDPFFIGGSSDYKIRWVGNEKNDFYGGTVFLSKQAYIVARSIGISVSLIRTSGLITTALMLSYDFADVNIAMDALNAETLYVDANALGMLGASAAHQYGEKWPTLMTKPVYDSEKPTDYAYSLLNPYHASFARVKTTYFMDFKETPQNLDDDSIVLQTNLNGYKLYGFAFVDKNNDGQFNERLSSHIMGVTVTLKDKNGQETAVTTSINGYYEFIVPKGEYTLSFACNGFAVKNENISVTVDGSKNFVFAPAAFNAK